MDWKILGDSFFFLFMWTKIESHKNQRNYNLISTYKMWVYSNPSNHKISFQFSLQVEETSKMQACKTFSSMHGQAWHFMYKKTIRKGSNMYKNHLRRQRSVWVTLNPNPAAANPCPRPPFTTLLLALLFLETMLPRKSRWLGIVYIHSIADACTSHMVPKWLRRFKKSHILIF